MVVQLLGLNSPEQIKEALLHCKTRSQKCLYYLTIVITITITVTITITITVTITITITITITKLQEPLKPKQMTGSVVHNTFSQLQTKIKHKHWLDNGTLFATDLLQAIIILQLSIQIHTILETNNN
jgi:hypothetical protein